MTAKKPHLDMNIVAAAIELRKQVILAASQDILELANAKLTNNKITSSGDSVVLRSPSMLDALKDAILSYGRARARKLDALGITGTDIISRVTINVGGKLKTRSYVPAPTTNGWNVNFVEVIDKALLATLTDAEVRRYFPSHAPSKPAAKVTPKDNANAQGRGSDKKPAGKKPAAAAKPAAGKKPAAAAKPSAKPVAKPAAAKPAAVPADKTESK